MHLSSTYHIHFFLVRHIKWSEVKVVSFVKAWERKAPDSQRCGVAVDLSSVETLEHEKLFPQAQGHTGIAVRRSVFCLAVWCHRRGFSFQEVGAAGRTNSQQELPETSCISMVTRRVVSCCHCEHIWVTLIMLCCDRTQSKFFTRRECRLTRFTRLVKSRQTSKFALFASLMWPCHEIAL